MIVLITYCVFCYYFVSGINIQLHTEKKRLAWHLVLFAPLSAPSLLGQMCMVKQKLNTKMLSRINARERKDKARINAKINESFARDLSEMSKAFDELYSRGIDLGKTIPPRKPFGR